MKIVRKFVLGLVSGVGLYFIWAWLVGYLAAVTIPKAYFAAFGTHEVAALILEEGMLVALPSFLFALLWGWLTQRLADSSRVSAWVVCVGCLVGLISAWAVELASLLPDLAAQTGAEHGPLPGLIGRLLVPGPWGVLDAAAAPAGIVVAWLIARGSNPPLEPTAPPSPRGAGAAAWLDRQAS